MVTTKLFSQQQLNVLLSKLFNIPRSPFTQNIYIPAIGEEELMGFKNDPVEPVLYESVVDDTVLKVSPMLSHNTQGYKVPNPDADDYLESLQKRWLS